MKVSENMCQNICSLIDLISVIWVFRARGIIKQRTVSHVN